MNREDQVVALFKEGDPAPKGIASEAFRPVLPAHRERASVSRSATNWKPPLIGLAVASILVATGLVLFSQPQLDESAVSPGLNASSIVGAFFSDGNWVLEVGSDGTLRNGTNRDRSPLHESQVISSGTFSIEGDTLTFVSDGSGICDAGTIATMRVERRPWGELTLSDVADDNQCWIDFSRAFVVADRFAGTWRPISGP